MDSSGVLRPSSTSKSTVVKQHVDLSSTEAASRVPRPKYTYNHNMSLLKLRKRHLTPLRQNCSSEEPCLFSPPLSHLQLLYTLQPLQRRINLNNKWISQVQKPKRHDHRTMSLLSFSGIPQIPLYPSDTSIISIVNQHANLLKLRRRHLTSLRQNHDHTTICSCSPASTDLSINTSTSISNILNKAHVLIRWIP